MEISLNRVLAFDGKFHKSLVLKNLHVRQAEIAQELLKDLTGCRDNTKNQTSLETEIVSGFMRNLNNTPIEDDDFFSAIKLRDAYDEIIPFDRFMVILAEEKGNHIVELYFPEQCISHPNGAGYMRQYFYYQLNLHGNWHPVHEVMPGAKFEYGGTRIVGSVNQTGKTENDYEFRLYIKLIGDAKELENKVVRVFKRHQVFDNWFKAMVDVE